MDYETGNEKYSGPSPNPNNKAKPMTFESGMGLMRFQFKIFPNRYNVLNVPKSEQQLIISL